MAEAI